MKKLLFTGGTGFLGKNVMPILEKQYEVTTCGNTHSDMIKTDLAKEAPTLIQHYDIVLHACGKAHVVPKTDAEKQLFYDVNLQGTKNLCEALEKANSIPKSLIFISTVAVYGCEFGRSITEEYPLDGNSPYALSKIQAEQYLTRWCSKNNITLGIIRPSLIAGKRPPGNLGTMIDGIKTGKYLRIGNGSAKKSVLMAEDIARIIPKLAEVGGTYNLCDNHHPSIAELDEIIAKQLNKKPNRSIPFWLAKSLARFGDLNGRGFPITTNKLNKITQSLTFSNEKARRQLCWEPTDVLSNFKIE